MFKAAFEDAELEAAVVPAWLTILAKGLPLSCRRSLPPEVLAVAGAAPLLPPPSDIPNRSRMLGTGSGAAAAAAGAADAVANGLPVA